MKFRGLLIAAVVLAGLGGFLYWSNHHKATTPPPGSKSPTVVKIVPADVTSLIVKQQGAPPVTLTRQAAGQWQITAPATYPADSSTVTSILSTLSPLLAVEVVQDKATNLAPFGLADPAVEVDVTTKDNHTHQVLVGDQTPAGEDVYVALRGDPRVYTAASYVKTSLNKSLSDLRDKRLLPVEASSVTTIDLTRKGQAIGFGRVQNGWQIQKPKPYRTDTFQVDDLLDQAVRAKWDPATSVEDATKSFAKATPVATLKLTGSSGTDTLEVRKENDNYYAKSSAITGVYQIDSTESSALAEALNRSLDNFRNKQLFNFGYSDPDKIQYQAGTTNLVLTHSGDDWFSNGKKMDNDSVEQVVTALRDLAASKFVDTGYSKPDITVTVTSDTDKKVVTVGIQKTKDGGGIAKREDDPSLYSLDGVTLEGLTSAVAGVKPAAPAKKK